MASSAEKMRSKMPALLHRMKRLLTEGQVSDYRGAATMLPVPPEADMLIADKVYDSDWFREALESLGIEPCIPGRSGRRETIEYNEEAYAAQPHRTHVR
jgi:transposase